MQAINRLLRKIVIVYPHLFRCSTIKYHKLLSTFVERPLCCLAFHHILRCSVFKVQFPVSFETRSKRTTLLCASIHSQFEIGGDSRDRTGDLLLARQALSQLSYIPIYLFGLLVGPSGLEPPTLRLSVVRSSQLSYGPLYRFVFSQQVNCPFAASAAYKRFAFAKPCRRANSLRPRIFNFPGFPQKR